MIVLLNFSFLIKSTSKTHKPQEFLTHFLLCPFLLTFFSYRSHLQISSSTSPLSQHLPPHNNEYNLSYVSFGLLKNQRITFFFFFPFSSIFPPLPPPPLCLFPNHRSTFVWLLHKTYGSGIFNMKDRNCNGYEPTTGNDAHVTHQIVSHLTFDLVAT